MAVAALQNVSYSIGERTLLRPFSLELKEGEKVGLIGANGCGKTTLFRIITGALAPDSGAVTVKSGAYVGYMRQIVNSKSERSVYDYALDVFEPLIRAENELDALTERLASGDEQTIERHVLMREKFEQDGGLTFRARTRAALKGLGLSDEQISMPIRSLSGGQLSKVALARLLLSSPDLLLLDEPTNHLDIQSVEWLEGFIKGFPGAAVIISHDRYFLDRVTSRTVEIEHETVSDFGGNYTKYMQIKAQRLETERREYENTMREITRLEGVIRQQHQWNRERNIRTADSKQKQVDRLRESLVVPQSELEHVKFTFACEGQSANDVMRIRGIGKAFGDNVLFDNVDLDVYRGERIFLLGANGCGKTTLIKMLADGCENVYVGPQVKIGYFDQTQRTLDDKKRAVDEVWDDYPKLSETQVRSAMAAFLFKDDEVYKRIGDMSGGERARVALLKLMLSGANLLLLDEPTNHLDIYSRAALEDALSRFGGTMIIVSHDRRFIDKLATKIWTMENGTVSVCNGNYS